MSDSAPAAPSIVPPVPAPSRTSRARATSAAKPKKKAVPKPLPAPKIITVFNMKGGCGKSTIAGQLGGTLGARGYRVLLVDMDLQSTTSRWSAQAPVDRPFPATVVSLAAYKDRAIFELQKLEKMYDFFIFDCAPALDSSVPWSALVSSHLGIIPVIPLLGDMWATNEAKILGVNAKQRNEKLQLCMIPSNVKRGAIYEVYLEQLRAEANEDIDVPKLQISSLNAYPESVTFGSTVGTSPKKSRSAIAEVDALTDYVLHKLGIKPTKG